MSFNHKIGYARVSCIDQDLDLRLDALTKAAISTVLWHANKTMTEHCSAVMILEIYEALEKIKHERAARTSLWRR